MTDNHDFWVSLTQAIKERVPEGAGYFICVLPPTLDPEEIVQMGYGGLNKEQLLWALERATEAVRRGIKFERVSKLS